MVDRHALQSHRVLESGLIAAEPGDSGECEVAARSPRIIGRGPGRERVSRAHVSLLSGRDCPPGWGRVRGKLTTNQVAVKANGNGIQPFQPGELVNDGGKGTQHR